jgi:asparagine synthase (glutamine-hydrolysing)
MCGIVGIINLNDQLVNQQAIEAMMARQRHRGPDDTGVFVEENVGLGFVRLSILDLSPAGHQPMISDDERYVLIFNGEIYNYVEIRKELEPHFQFRSQGDTEVLLNAYRHWGPDCLHRFNGMFAFAIFDRQEKTIFAARDRFGVKPVYYYLDNNQFVFASEIPPIFDYVKSVGKPLSPDNTVMYEYLLYGRTDQTQDTFVSQIKKLQHGHCLNIKHHQVTINRWYKLEERLTVGWESPEEYYETFRSSVALRLRSDVPVGICLSGGLDSSAVASTLVKGLNRADFYAFSAIYGEGQAGDEQPYIREYEHQLANLVYVKPTEQTLHDDLDELMRCHFEPFGGLSIYSQFKLMKDASRYLKVLMDGQGADEQLGGYVYFFGSHFRQLVQSFQWARLVQEAVAYYQNHRSLSAFGYMGFYMLPNSLKSMAAYRKAAFISPDFHQAQARVSTINDLIYSPRSLHDSLLQHFESKLEHNLKWNDLNSMYFSIELREPFLDYRLVEKTLASPSDLIIKNGTTKWILRQAMRGTLPERIRTRHGKIGFENPADEWMRTPMFQEKAQNALNNKALSESGYFNMKECANRLAMHRTGKINAARDIWQWIEVAHFLEKF